MTRSNYENYEIVVIAAVLYELCNYLYPLIIIHLLYLYPLPIIHSKHTLSNNSNTTITTIGALYPGKLEQIQANQDQIEGISVDSSKQKFHQVHP